MTPILEHVILSIQGAFVLKRAIQDTILLAHEIMNKFNNAKDKKAYTHTN